MAVGGSLQITNELGICKTHVCHIQFLSMTRSRKLHLLKPSLSSLALRLDPWSIRLSGKEYRPKCPIPYKRNVFKCHSFLNPSKGSEISCMKNAAIAFTRSCNAFQGSPIVLKLVSAVGIIVFAVWGLGPLMRQCRNMFLHKSDSSWKKSGTYYVTTSYLQPFLLWTGATLICRVLNPIVLPSEASQIVKQRLLGFIRSLSAVLALAYCLSSVIQQAQKFFMETNASTDPRNMGFQFAGKAVYTAVWVAAVSLFMELLGFSTQKWLTAGGLGTVLLTLAGREIFTNFLSSAMIHATRPFIVNEWIQTKIEGYEVSGTVEHVGWWSPTIVRGEDREAVHIPNHKFTVNVVRNLTQKTHWRIKTHLAISHLDVNKINNIVADMRKVLAKNPQVEHKRLHRRVFLENINSENQALLILISCFVKTSHLEEYLCVKEAILLDLLRVISHHRARLATPIRTVQKIYSDPDLDNIPFSDSFFTHGGAASNRPLLLIEPPYKINGEDRTKPQNRSVRTNGEQDSKTAVRSPPDDKTDSKGGAPPIPQSKAKETISETKIDVKAGETQNPDTKGENTAQTSTSDRNIGDKEMAKPTSNSATKTDSKLSEVSSSDSKAVGSTSIQSTSNNKQTKKTGSGNAQQNSTVNIPSASFSETGGEKPEEFPSTPQAKQESERPQQPISRPPLGENIVLGVALEGSKRTLPIEEGMASSPTQAEVKELAQFRNGNGSLAAEKDKKDGQPPTVPSSTSGDQQDQQD
ncbi:mechanosensitive ion channel protein 2, chloroplastic-like isoform X3 [Actinidia eriantha]|nr:mechanosensitive ion channel protein 2, chloroplastic-like isoform X3 [Actinidia eriantha]XP_057496912.1 mechanosensitive ion channel protein 2, chloroplastic-like isoform X3 [Actinidia eriantha]XP_057496913.1 mechanosensitive ion channel protein 2, chloroplastic-like isoform X3 [Actinidia eriantha]XP_057496914.1 mechanosensitive ion channel protein 2, chloroplastic-like isoform X3 [Actinidia eriantha]XP_057496915.1 mechanosensitive ion channel protein 2, chloroplastic-like isoform X3 [Actin